jgi:hypothetical protein
MSLPLAHISGIPVEEAVGALGPALLVAVGAASATLRARGGRLARRIAIFGPSWTRPQACEGGATGCTPPTTHGASSASSTGR